MRNISRFGGSFILLLLGVFLVYASYASDKPELYPKLLVGAFGVGLISAGIALIIKPNLAAEILQSWPWV